MVSEWVDTKGLRDPLSRGSSRVDVRSWFRRVTLLTLPSLDMARLPQPVRAFLPLGAAQAAVPVPPGACIFQGPRQGASVTPSSDRGSPLLTATSYDPFVHFIHLQPGMCCLARSLELVFGE